jgi:hypothetical protein
LEAVVVSAAASVAGCVGSRVAECETLGCVCLHLLQARGAARAAASVYRAPLGGSEGVAGCLVWHPDLAQLGTENGCLGTPSRRQGGAASNPVRPSTAPAGGGSLSPTSLDIWSEVGGRAHILWLWPVAIDVALGTVSARAAEWVLALLRDHPHHRRCCTQFALYSCRYPAAPPRRASRRAQHLSNAAAPRPTCEPLPC